MIKFTRAGVKEFKRNLRAETGETQEHRPFEDQGKQE
jgi:hypothetical protein